MTKYQPFCIILKPQVRARVELKSAGAKQMVASVEQTTGYKAIIEWVEGIAEDAQMITARPPELTNHTIRVSRAQRRYTDYIVANSCALLLRFWAEPARIPVFKPLTEKVNYLAGRTAGSKPLSQHPAMLAQEIGMRLVQGLLQQVLSMPLEILAVRDCWEWCPDLRDMQAKAAQCQLRRMSDILRQIGSIAPDEISRSHTSMNAAFALNWSQLLGDSRAMLPYESAGLAEIAAKLLGLVHANGAKTTDSYTRMVDAWAEQVGLRTLYAWEYRDGRK